MFRSALAYFSLTLFAATDAAASLCVENKSREEWLFTAAIDNGARARATLAPDARLCVEGNGPGTVAVFASVEELEGCSRRVPSDSIAQMLDFPGVDLCAWAAAPSE